MNQNRKILGMTTTQIAILAGLAVLACLLFGLVGWLALQGSSNLFAPAPQITSIVQSTATPFLIPTLTQTETPTSTPSIPYETLIPDKWLQYKTGLVEIWLPAQFKKGDPQLFKDSANMATPELLMTGLASKTSLYQMFVILSYEPLTADSLDAYLDAQILLLPTNIRMAERKKVTVNSTDAVRFVFETRSDNIDITDLTYVFLDGTTIWYVEYAAQINDFYEMLPTFEQSVKTFRIVR